MIPSLLLQPLRTWDVGVDFHLLADPVFLLFCLTYGIGTPCVYGIWTCLPSLALERGLSKADATALVVINSAASHLGKNYSRFSLTNETAPITDFIMSCTTGSDVLGMFVFFSQEMVLK